MVEAGVAVMIGESQSAGVKRPKNDQNRQHRRDLLLRGNRHHGDQRETTKRVVDPR